MASPSTARLGRWLAAGMAALAALLCLGLSLFLAARHPLSPLLALAAVLLVTALARFFWASWPGWFLALVPLIGLAPWTGWLWLEEWHLLLLASAAGGYAAVLGAPVQPQHLADRPLRLSLPIALLLLLAAAMTMLAVVRGVVDGGGLNLSLFQGYHDTGQALRVGMPVLALLLMLPLWRRSARLVPERVAPALSLGMLGVLAVVAGGALLERLTYTGLTDFTSDYRTTSVFWEMHVGGAALDGALAMSLPFALLALLQARTARASALAMALALLGLYALLTTFSRGLYLGALLGLVLSTGLWWRQQAVIANQGQSKSGNTAFARDAQFGLAALVLLAAGAGWLLFPGSGYRGLLCLCATVLALLMQPSPTRRLSVGQRLVSTALGLVIAVPVVGLSAVGASVFGKLAYLAFALGFGLNLLLARLAWRDAPPWNSNLFDSLRAGVWLALVGQIGVVAWNWGGDLAARQSLLPLALLAIAWPLTQGGRIGAALSELGWRPRWLALGGILLGVSVVAALSGGQYIAGRASTTGQDLTGRLAHWQRTPEMVNAARAQLFGIGAGRYPPHFMISDDPATRTGDLRFQPLPEPHVVLASGHHVLGFGEMLRLSQQLSVAPAGLVLQLQMRNAQPLTLHAEVCQRHLIYTSNCLTQALDVPASADYKPLRLVLGGDGGLSAGGWLRPGLVFAVSLASRGTRADVRQFSLQGSDGQELLRNGDLQRQMAHWFMSSDRHHLPWHAKSLPLHWYFEQGAVGLLLNLALLALALARVTVGGAAAHPLAPALAGALVGFLVVGLFDSLVDSSRIAFLYGTLLLCSLSLRATVARQAVEVRGR